MELSKGCRIRYLDTNKEGTIIDFLTKQETKECLMYGQFVKVLLDDGTIDERCYDYEVISRNYYEVEFGRELFDDNKENKENTSICIIAEHWPSIEEVSIFCKKDMEALGYKYVIGVTKLDDDEAKRFFDLSNEESWPILK